MKRREFDLEFQDQAVAELKELRLLDDVHYAHAWVRTRDRLSPRGAFVLRQELSQRGIARHIIDEVLQERKEAEDDEDSEQPTEMQLAQELVERKTRLYSNLSPEVRNRRLMGVLQRRGFSLDTIRRILKV
jgi:regulatory protein